MLNSGKAFEKDFKKSVEDDGFYYHRLNDPAQSFNTSDTSNILRFSLKNPYDCFIFSSPFLITLELKSTQGTSMTFYREDFEKDGCKNTYMVKKHQILGLKKASLHNGVVAGLVLNFRKTNNTYFQNVDDFIRMINLLNKKSFNEADLQSNNGSLIEQKLKRVRYKYNISKFIQDIKNAG